MFSNGIGQSYDFGRLQEIELAARNHQRRPALAGVGRAIVMDRLMLEDFGHVLQPRLITLLTVRQSYLFGSSTGRNETESEASRGRVPGMWRARSSEARRVAR